ncbi:MAG TPA: hypothetical protein VHX18_05615 [Rhizomicrobium sp.]|nr:hypothetical protein [Rhizomicrobium sp.]
MKHAMPGAMLALLVLAGASASADELKEFRCGRTLETQGGLPQLVVDDQLHVLDRTSANAKFDPGPVPPGASIKSIFCARSDIVPAPSDYKVVEAGYPLTIFARDASGKTRIAVLELDGGQLRLRSVGEIGFTPDMVHRIQAFPDASLPQFGKTASAR